MDEFKFGTCKICKNWASLKNEVCLVCSQNEEIKNPLPDFIKDLFEDK